MTYRFTQNSGLLEIFINGILTGRITNGNPMTATPTTFYIGNREALDRGWNGEINQLMMYDRFLSEREIKNNFIISQERYAIPDLILT